MAIIEVQKVNVKWNGNNRSIYESKGYTFTNYGDVFEVHIRDIAPSSHYEVRFECDYCEDVFF